MYKEGSGFWTPKVGVFCTPSKGTQRVPSVLSPGACVIRWTQAQPPRGTAACRGEWQEGEGRGPGLSLQPLGGPWTGGRASLIHPEDPPSCLFPFSHVFWPHWSPPCFPSCRWPVPGLGTSELPRGRLHPRARNASPQGLSPPPCPQWGGRRCVAVPAPALVR